MGPGETVISTALDPNMKIKKEAPKKVEAKKEGSGTRKCPKC